MSTIRIFFKNKWLEIAVVAIAFQLITNAVSIFLNNKPLALILTAVGLILLITLVTYTYDAVMGRKKIKSFIDKNFNINRKGIIFTLGISSHLPTSAQMKVINTLKPQLVGFLTTNEIETNRHVVEQIVNAKNLSNDNYRNRVVDPTNIKEIKESTSHIIEWMLQSITREDIVVDITGGTAVMSLGAYQAAEEYGIEVQYIFSDYDYNQNRVIPNTQKALIVSSKRNV